MQKETIPFKIILEADYKFIPPKVQVDINNNTVFEGKLKVQKTIIETVQDLTFGQTHCIKILRSGKENKFPEQTCRVLDVEIDGISVRDLVWHTSQFYPEYPEPWATEQKQQGFTLEYPVFGETIFGHNGTWVFEFSSPFYNFLIQKVKG